MSLVLDDKEWCLAFVAEQIGDVIAPDRWYEAIGFERGGELVVAVIFTLMTEVDIVMHVAAKKGSRWCTRDFLGAAFRYPFEQLGLKRVTGFVPADNVDALKLNEHVGFVREGLLRQGAENGHDMIVMGMLRRECRYLGQEIKQSARAA